MQHAPPPSSEAAAPVALGDVLAGKYRVDRVLGAGGMGVVVAATHLQLGQKVALKFLLPAAFRQPQALERFLREGRAAVQIKSEHVARVSDVGVLESGAPYMVMEYLEGSDLGDVLAERGGRLPIAEAAFYLLQACEALAEAHAAGIVHRDLKPANLFLTRRADGSPLVKVLDFGISKAGNLGDGVTDLTGTNVMMGSPLYMSPEQLRSSKHVDHRTDVWSLGVMLYELVSGAHPFPAETLGGLLARIAADEPVSLGRALPDAPPALEALIARCLDKDPERRVATVAEFAQGLAPLAPAEFRASVDRIVRVVGGSSAQSLPVTFGSPGAPGPAPSIQLGATAPASALGAAAAISAPLATQPAVSGLRTDQMLGVGATQASPAAPRRGLPVVAILAVLLLLGMGTLFLLRNASSSASGASAEAPAGTGRAAATQVAAAPPAAVPPSASAEAAAAPAVAASASPRASPERPKREERARGGADRPLPKASPTKGSDMYGER